MSDHDELSRRLRELAADAAQDAEMRTGAEVRRRAGRRRTATVVAASVAAAGLVMGTYSVAASLDEQRSVGPVTSPSPTIPTATQPGPTAPTENQPSPTALTASQPTESQATESKPTKSQPTETSSTPHGDWITTIPADVELPHEGVTSQFSEFSDWAPAPSHRSWRLLPCLEQEGYPADAEQTDRRSILQTAPELAYAEQLALYPDGATAATAIEEMQASLSDCAEQLTYADGHNSHYQYWSTQPAELTGQGSPDHAFHAWSGYRMYDADGQVLPLLGGEFFTVVREGNAIYLTMSSGETDFSYSSAVDREVKAQTRQAAQLLPTLCRFAGHGGC